MSVQVTNRFLGDLERVSKALEKQKEAGFNYFNIFDAFLLGESETHHSIVCFNSTSVKRKILQH